jgi:hypothetical protein
VQERLLTKGLESAKLEADSHFALAQAEKVLAEAHKARAEQMGSISTISRSVSMR